MFVFHSMCSTLTNTDTIPRSRVTHHHSVRVCRCALDMRGLVVGCAGMYCMLLNNTKFCYPLTGFALTREIYLLRMLSPSSLL